MFGYPVKQEKRSWSDRPNKSMAGKPEGELAQSSDPDIIAPIEVVAGARFDLWSMRAEKSLEES